MAEMARQELQSDKSSGEAANGFRQSAYASREIEGRDSVSLYLEEIARAPLLDAETEVELAQTIEAGLKAEKLLEKSQDGSTRKIMPGSATEEELVWLAEQGRSAVDQFITSNLRLVVSIARKYGRAEMPMLDIIQEGSAGLIRAVEKFDYQKGYKFSTYATWWIRQAITRGIAQQSRNVRLPVHVVEQLNQVGGARRTLERSLGREPEPDEIAAELGIDANRVIDLLDWGRQQVSLDAPVDDDGATSYGDLIGDTVIPAVDDQVVSSNIHEELQVLISHLDERSADIISRRYGLADGRQHKLTDIASSYGISVGRVSQLQRQALIALRQLDNGEMSDAEISGLKPAPRAEKLGQRATIKRELAVQLKAAGERLHQQDIATLEAYISSSSYASAAARLEISARTFRGRYMLAKAALDAVRLG